jgi:hypothetical protein
VAGVGILLISILAGLANAFTFVGEFLLMLWLLLKGRTISAIG